jgi:nucleoside-diphosphate kinase
MPYIIKVGQTLWLELEMLVLVLTKEGAEEFYEEHRGKGFFDDLARITSSGPVWALVLAKTNAVQEWRDTIGATNSAEAEPGTIRHDFGDHNYVPKNAVHGSASDHDAKREINFFFGQEIKLAQKVADIQKT